MALTAIFLMVKLKQLATPNIWHYVTDGKQSQHKVVITPNAEIEEISEGHWLKALSIIFLLLIATKILYLRFKR